MDPTHQFISDAALRLMGISDRTLVDYIQAIGTLPALFETICFGIVLRESLPRPLS